MGVLSFSCAFLRHPDAQKAESPASEPHAYPEVPPDNLAGELPLLRVLGVVLMTNFRRCHLFERLKSPILEECLRRWHRRGCLACKRHAGKSQPVRPARPGVHHRATGTLPMKQNVGIF